MIMAFRKPKEASLDWQRWLARFRSSLVLCGVPEEAYQSQRHWWYFLDHASMSTGKEMHWFSLDKLSLVHLKKLHALLEEQYGSFENVPFLLSVVRTQLR